MKINLKENWLYAVIGAIIGTFVFFYCFGGFAEANSVAEFFDFNFEDYNDGALNGQGAWTADANFTISNEITLDYNKALKIDNQAESYKSAYTNLSAEEIVETGGTETFTWDIIPKTNLSSGNLIMYIQSATGYIFYSAFQHQGGTSWRFEDSGGSPQFGATTITTDNWVKCEYIIDWDVGDATFNIYDSNDNLLGTYDNTYSSANFTGIKFVNFDSWNAKLYFEGFGIPIPEADIYAISPESMTEITSLSTSFTFGWEGVADYDLMSVGFKNRGSGISSDYLTYEIGDLTGTSTTVNMDAFNIQNNGSWYFQGFVGTLTPEVLYGNTFTGNYMSSLSEDLAEDDNYYLTFNIEGLESIFIMPDFENWYTTNSTRYDSPTDMFVAITDLFTPIFSKIGEFGRRIQDYFDIDEAHQNGYDIGKSIPVFGYYLTQIGYFVGNFPFLKWFFIIISFFLGVFVFRLILKFIPGLG